MSKLRLFTTILLITALCLIVINKVFTTESDAARVEKAGQISMSKKGGVMGKGIDYSSLTKVDEDIYWKNLTVIGVFSAPSSEYCNARTYKDEPLFENERWIHIQKSNEKRDLLCNMLIGAMLNSFPINASITHLSSNNVEGIADDISMYQ